MIENALKAWDINFRFSAGQVVMDCLYCNDTKGHLYIDPDKKVFFCQKCNEKGTWYQLSKELRPEASIMPFSRSKAQYKFPDITYIENCHKRLLSPSGVKAYEYLQSRKFTNEAIKHFQLGLERDNNINWLVIPYFKDGKPVNIKYRSLPPIEKEFKRWKGGESVLFNQDCLKENFKEVFFVEGETDCIALWSQGYKNVIATSVGAGSFKAEWVDLLEKIPRINVLYDSDEKGRKGAKEVSKRLGFDRCFNIVLPVNDINDFFISGGSINEFEEIVGKSEPFEIDNIIDFSKAVPNLKSQSNRSNDNEQLKPHWHNVTKLTGSFEAGDLITVSAIPKTGKSTWALNIVHDFVRKDIPCLFYCLEMRTERLARKTLQIELNCTEEDLNSEKMDTGYIRLMEKPLYFGYNYRKCNLDIVIDTIRHGTRRYGFEFVVFDKLHYLSRSISNSVQEVSLISKTFKLLAEELQIPIMLIAQPRKVSENQVMSMMDLKDSSSIGADSDQIVILYRKKKKSEDGTAEASYEPLTLVRADASRYRSGGETLLYFDGARSVFKEIEKGRINDCER